MLYLRKHGDGIGVLTVVLLTILSDAMKAFKGLVQRLDITPAVGLRHSSTMLRLLIETGLASRATR